MAETTKIKAETKKIKLENVYARTEDGKGYKVYDELIIEYQYGDNDEKFAEAILGRRERTLTSFEAYDMIAEDMIISPEQAKSHKFFGKNAGGIVPELVPILFVHGNEDMVKANKKLKITRLDGE